MATNGKKTGIVIFIIILVLALGIGVYDVLSQYVFPAKENVELDLAERLLSKTFSGNSKSKKKGEFAKINHKGEYIAKLYITGTIEDANEKYNQKWLLSAIKNLSEDKNNVGTILFINTPGGGVYQSDEVYLALRKYAKEKPLYAYMGSLATSGGYYIACASSYIMANRNTLTGSIGVLAGQSVDLTGLMEKVGVKSETIHAGANKNMGNVNEPLTAEQRAILQSIADEAYEQFTGIVAESRGMPLADVKKLADGRVYTARQAMDKGLVDSIGTWDDVVNQMQSKEFDLEEYDVVDVSYEYERSFPNWLLGSLSSLISPKAAASELLPEVVENAVSPKTPYPAYYYNFN